MSPIRQIRQGRASAAAPALKASRAKLRHPRTMVFQAIIRSTASRDLMMKLGTTTSLGEPEPQEPDLTAQSLLLLGALESSLRGSHGALLARDIGRLEELTREQSQLQRALLRLWKSARPLSMSNQLWMAQTRILHLSRVQRGILSRLNRGLTMLTHLAAGTNADYAFAAAQATISLHPASPASTEA
jgi:hypothetical protein